MDVCNVSRTVRTLVECGRVAAEAPQPIQGAQLAQHRSETSRCVLVSGQIMKSLEAVVFYVGDGQGAAVVNLNTHTQSDHFKLLSE